LLAGVWGNLWERGVEEFRRDPEDMGAGSYRMILVCPDVATCRTAAQRVTDAPLFALGVDIEGSTRQRIPLKPTRAMSR
jgi:hypothetical protein